jgi:TusA-related sulfurtransferase
MAGSAASADETVLDVRGTPAPDDVLAVLKRVSGLAKGAKLQVQLNSNPFQLYDLLQQRGYFLELTPQDDGSYRGYVKQRDIEALSH